MFNAQKFQFRLHFTLGCGYLHEIEIFSVIWYIDFSKTEFTLTT